MYCHLYGNTCIEHSTLWFVIVVNETCTSKSFNKHRHTKHLYNGQAALRKQSQRVAQTTIAFTLSQTYICNKPFSDASLSHNFPFPRNICIENTVRSRLTDYGQSARLELAGVKSVELGAPAQFYTISVAALNAIVLTVINDIYVTNRLEKVTRFFPTCGAFVSTSHKFVTNTSIMPMGTID